MDAFVSAVGQRGVLRTNKHMAFFTLPLGLRGPRGDAATSDSVARDINMWCDSASLPGVQFENTRVRRYGYGPNRTRPLAPAFQDVALTFIADAKGLNWYFFRNWFLSVGNFDSRNGVSDGVAPADATVLSGNNPYDTYEVGYEEDYITNLYVSAFDDAGNEIIRAVYQDAYPTALSDIQMDWGDDGKIAKFAVSFTYLDWFVDTDLRAVPRATPDNIDFTQQSALQAPLNPPIQPVFNTSAVRTLTQ